jgi:hypothetical protein
MTSDAARRKKGRGPGWVATLLGLVVLVAGGFVLGLVVGVVSEEPELVVGHLTGRSTEIEWSGDLGPQAPDDSEDPGIPHVAAPGPSFGRPVAESVPESSPAPSHSARPAATRSMSGPEPFFAIQVGAFGDSEAAQDVASHLRESGYPVRVLEPASDDRWRVRVGPVEGRDQADQLAARLKSEEQLPTWVLREQGS